MRAAERQAGARGGAREVAARVGAARAVEMAKEIWVGAGRVEAVMVGARVGAKVVEARAAASKVVARAVAVKGGAGMQGWQMVRRGWPLAGSMRVRCGGGRMT